MKNYTFKKILVPVDFSKTSHQVFHHVKYIAAKFSSEVTLMHINEELPFSNIFPFLLEKKEDLQTAYKEAVIPELEKLRNELLEAGIKTVNIEYTEGSVVNSITHLIESEKIDLVAMGTHGAKGITGFLLGSNAYKIVNSVHIPVLTVHEKSAFGTYKNIVVPLDDSFYSRAKFTYVAELAQIFGASIEILYPKRQDAESIQLIKAYFTQVSNFLESKKIIHMSREVEGNFAHEIVKFAEYTAADLVVIMSDAETTISNMLIGAKAHDIISHSHVPVFTLPALEGGELMDDLAFSGIVSNNG
jgi:nucleotide-binding universal stress UspA family protein